MGKKGGGGDTVVGYRYYMTMLMGLCRGPVDRIVAIKVGDQLAWTGSVADNTVFDITADTLFGGDDKEGGIAGPVTAMFGAPDQDISGTAVPGIIGEDMSDLRGVTTLLFNDGLLCSNNPYPKPWAIRAQRALKGWYGGTAWYPDEAVIALFDDKGNSIYATNPAHIIYECLTNPVWGRGLKPSQLDETSFISAANVLCREQFGLCLKWSRSSGLDRFVQLVIDHIAGAMYVDRETGLLNLRLLRNDYDPNELPVFDYSSGLLRIEDDATTAPDNSHSELIVTWHDPVSDVDRQTRVQNLAGIQANQTIASTTTEYTGIPTSLLAAQVAQRDMMMQGSGIKRYTLTLDRRGRKIAPAGVFRINVPSRGIENMVLRAGRVEEGPITGQTVTVTALQDVFSLESTTYIVQEIGHWVEPDRSALAAETRRIDEFSYRDAVRILSPADLALVAVDSGDILVAAKQPTGLSTDYVLTTAASGEEFADHGRFAWTPTLQIVADVGYYDTAFSFTPGLPGLNRITVPCVAWLGNECVLVTAFDPTAGTATIGRGATDTIPAFHAADERVWFYEFGGGADGREYTTGEDIDVKIRTRTNSEELLTGSTPTDAYTITGRQGRPYPPGDVRVNGERFGDGLHASGNLVLTWTHRDRITQADHVLVHEDGSTGPEAGTSYNCRFYDGVTLLRTEVTSAATFTYTTTMSATDGSISPLTLELESERDGIVSHQKYRWTIIRDTIPGSGWGNNYGNDYGLGNSAGYGEEYGNNYGL